MSVVRAVGGRAVAAGRRSGAARDWPLLAAGVLALLAMVQVIASPPVRTGDAAATALSAALLLALCATVPLALVRAHPLAAAATLTAATLLTLWTGYRLTVPGLVAVLAALYLAGRRSARRRVLLIVVPFVVYALVPVIAVTRTTCVRAESQASAGAPVDRTGDCTTAGVAATADGSARSGSDPVSRLPAVLLLAGAAVAVGAGQGRRLRGEAARRTESRQAIADTLVEYAARGERARIARELHDVVAHHISMIAVQAETARLTTAGMPSEGARRLTAIGDTARDALTEMRRLLGVLREDAGAEPTREPQPGLARLTELIDEARELSGASTRLIVCGRVAPLEPGLELTAYRIVQEALTNARRHAAGAAVDVELRYGEHTLGLRIRDNGPGPRAGTGTGAVGGHGLAGMAERVGVVGGTLRTGPAPRGGFLVEAQLPIPEPPA